MRRAHVTPLALLLLAPALACSGSKATPTGDGASSGAAPTPPASVTCASFAGPTATAEMRGLLYASLIGDWGYSYCGGTCPKLSLDPMGGYTLSIPSGYSGGPTPQSRVDTGSWNFAAIDSTHGVVCLDGKVAAATHEGGEVNLPSVLQFSFPPTGRSPQVQLQIGGYSFSLVGIPSPLNGVSADMLPNVKVSPAFAALVSAQLIKTNPFDPTTVPNTLAVDQSGRFTAAFGPGVCPQLGALSIDRDTLLTNEGTASPSCGAGYGGRLESPIVPGFFDDLVVLGQGSYRKSTAAAGAPNAFVFDPYGRSVRVTGTYDGALKAGAATKIALTFENADASLVRTLGTFTASIQPATVQYGQATTAGALVPLGSVDLGGVALGPGEKTTASITVTPPAAGDTYAFQLRVTFTDATKKYDGGHTFLTPVAP